MTNMNQNGRSMIEMLGVLAIIGVLSVGGIAGYSKAMLKYKTNKLIDGVAMLTTNIRTLYAQQKTFTGLDGRDAGGTGDFDDGATAIAMGVVPDELIRKRTSGNTTTTDLKNPFAGTIVLDVDDSVPSTAGANRAFIIGVNGIPREACMAFATSDWGSNYSSGLIAMAVKKDGSSAAESLTGAKKAYAGADCAASSNQGTLGTDDAICAAHMPLQVAAAATACECDGSSCSVAIKYY